MSKSIPLVAAVIALAVALPSPGRPAAADDKGYPEVILDIAHEWAHANYQVPRKHRHDALARLEKKEDEVIRRYPGHAEPLIWKGITLATDASISGSFSALSKARRAREVLLRAAKIDAKAMKGAIYTTLGTLYFKVPGWPLSFGNDKTAKALLERGLELNPTGMEANYFYGDYLFHKGHYEQALQVLNKALNAPDRPDRPVTDKGRREETRRLITKVKAEMSG